VGRLKKRGRKDIEALLWEGQGDGETKHGTKASEVPKVGGKRSGGETFNQRDQGEEGTVSQGGETTRKALEKGRGGSAVLKKKMALAIE